MAVTSVKPGVTVNPPGTALSSVTVNVMAPSSPLFESSIVTAGSLSSSMIVPVAVDASTVCEVPETPRPSVKVSSVSNSVSSAVATVNVFVSPLVPANSSAAVFAV